MSINFSSNWYLT